MIRINFLGSQGSKAARNGKDFEKICGLNPDKLHPKYYFDEMNKNNNKFIIFDGTKVVCESHPQKRFKSYLDKVGISPKDMDMPNLEPDNFILNFENNTIYVIEIKFQNKEGSVDEKPQAYLFRQRYFNDLFKSMGMEVKLIYVFSDWFKMEKYNYLRKNMDQDGVKYYYNELPPSAIGLDEKE